MGKVVEGYSSYQAMRITGLSYKNIRTLAENGLITPSVAEGRRHGNERNGRGGHEARRYSYRDLILLKLAADLYHAGVSPHALRSVNSVLRSFGAAADMFVIATGDQVQIASGASLASMLKSSQRAAAIVIDIQESERAVREALEKAA